MMHFSNGYMENKFKLKLMSFTSTTATI